MVLSGPTDITVPIDDPVSLPFTPVSLLFQDIAYSVSTKEGDKVCLRALC